jgi:hypothetical protein
MTSFSLNTSARRSGHAKVAMNVIRGLAILTVLLLAAAVEVAAQTYFDPQGVIAASQIFAAP